ncbi:MAG: S1 RNA-binding domain-containing protein, partial [Patescibacteria group bacterium]
MEKNQENSILAGLLEKDDIRIPRAGDTVIGKIISASKSEVRLDIEGIFTGIVRGPELYFDDDEFENLKPGVEVEATVIDEENERGELELSFRQAGQEKAWAKLEEALKNKEVIKVKILDANKGGLLVKHNQITGFLPVSQLSPENYPRVSGGDKQKILEKLKSFVGNEIDVNVINLGEDSDKIIFSEKDVW